MVADRSLASMILWGPPGCGKTTIARLLAETTDLEFAPLSAVFSGVADLRKIFERARLQREAGRGTLLFVDEIHRFNRAQQDAFLPYVEDGTVVLIGALAWRINAEEKMVRTVPGYLQYSAGKRRLLPAVW